MEKRPRIKIALRPFDRTVEALSWFSLALLWLVVLFNYAQLPLTIASHFNAAGVVDGYGDKKEIFTLPIIGTFIFVLLTVLNNYPHLFNYPTNITPQNALVQYTNATKMLRYLKFAIGILFLLITTVTLKVAAGKAEGLGPWFLPISLGLIFTVVAFFIVKSLKRNKS